MAWDVDSLIDVLVDQISLAAGSSIDDVRRLTHDIVLEKSKETNNGTENLPIDVATVGEDVILDIWQKLASHSDIIRASADHERSSGPEEPNFTVRATEEQKWHAITGHAIDAIRLSHEDFRILTFVAAAGQEGVSQNELGEQTGANKRTFGIRIANLHRKGYVAKRQERGAAASNGIITLQRFRRSVNVPPLHPSCSSRRIRQDSHDILQNNVTKVDDELSPGRAPSPSESQGIRDTVAIDESLPLCQEKVAGLSETNHLTPRREPEKGSVHIPLANKHEYVGKPSEPNELAISRREGEGTEAEGRLILGSTRLAIEHCSDSVQQEIDMGSPPNTSFLGNDSVLPPEIQPRLQATNHITQRAEEIAPSNEQEFAYTAAPIVNIDDLAGKSPEGAEGESLKLGGIDLRGAADRTLGPISTHLDKTRAPVANSKSLSDHATQNKHGNAVDGNFRMDWHVSKGPSTIPNTKANLPRQRTPWYSPIQTESLPSGDNALHLSINSKQQKAFQAQMWKLANGMLAKETILGAGSQCKTNQQGERIAKDGADPGLFVHPYRELRETTPSDELDSTASRKRRRFQTEKALDGEANLALNTSAEMTDPRPGISQVFTSTNARSSHKRPASMFLERSTGKKPCTAELETRESAATFPSAEPIPNPHVQNLFENLLNISYPGTYINPPSRLPQTSRGRPRKRLLVVIKLDQLQQLAWFRDCPDAEKMRYAPVVATERTVHSNEFKPQRVQKASQRSERPKKSLVVAIKTAGLHSLDWFAGHLDEDAGPSIDLAKKRARHTIAPTSMTAADEDVPHTISGTSSEQSHSVPHSTHWNHIVPAVGISVNQSLVDVANRAPDAIAGDVYATSGPGGIKIRESQLFKDDRAAPRREWREKNVLGQDRHRLLLSIVKKAGGAFPGNSEIWYPYVTEAHKIAPLVTPYRTTIDNAVNAMIRASKLKRAIFAFRDAAGGLVQKSILCLPSVSFQSPQVKTCEKGITEAHPFMYFPDGIEIRPDLDPSRKSQGFRTHSRENAVSTYHGNAHEKLMSQVSAEDIVGEPGQLKWVFEEVSARARMHEALREQAAWEAELDTGRLTYGIVGQAPVDVSAWIISMTRKRLATSRHIPGFATCATLTDPRQTWSENNGTISTDFATYRSSRPKLTVDTNMQHRFESSLPADLEEMVANYSRTAGSGVTAFDKTVEAVEAWEMANAGSLTSEKSLITPRFINFGPQIMTSAPPAAPITEDMKHFTKIKPKLRTQDKARPSSQWHIHYPGAQKSAWPRQPTGNASRTKKTQEHQSQLNGNLTLQPNGLECNIECESPPSLAPVSTEPLANLSQAANTLTQASSQIAQDSPSLTDVSAKTSRSFEDLSDEAALQRLVIATTMIKVLLGGVKRKAVWSIILRFFPGFSTSVLSQRYTAICRHNKPATEWYLDAFQEAFLVAYAANEVTTIDYGDIGNYDWEAVMDWALQRWPVPIARPVARPVLPASRNKFNEQFELQVDSMQKPAIHVSTGALFNAKLRGGNARRMQTMQNLIVSCPLQACQRVHASPDILDAARTHVRAIVFAPDDRFRTDEAYQKLTKFDDTVVKEAINDLMNRKIISRIASSNELAEPFQNRAYKPNERFTTRINDGWTPRLLRAAAAYKLELDTHFLDTGPDITPNHHINLAPTCANPAQALVLTSLLSQKQISLRPHLARLMSKSAESSFVDPSIGENSLGALGFANADHTNEGTGDAALGIPLRITVTGTYTAGLPFSDRTPTPDPPAPHLLLNPEERSIPLWYTIHDELMLDMWEKILVAVLMQIVLRPGIEEEGIVVALGGILELWDVKLIIGWLLDFNVVRKDKMEGDRLGLGANEGWWSVLGPGSPVTAIQ